MAYHKLACQQTKADGLSILDAFITSGLASSKGEVRRLIKGGGAQLNGAPFLLMKLSLPFLILVMKPPSAIIWQKTPCAFGIIRLGDTKIIAPYPHHRPRYARVHDQANSD